MAGDLLTLLADARYSAAELATYPPVAVLVDEHNRPKTAKMQRSSAGLQRIGFPLVRGS